MPRLTQAEIAECMAIFQKILPTDEESARLYELTEKFLAGEASGENHPDYPIDYDEQDRRAASEERISNHRNER